MSATKRKVINLQTLVDKGVVAVGAAAVFYHERAEFSCNILKAIPWVLVQMLESQR